MKTLAFENGSGVSLVRPAPASKLENETEDAWLARVAERSVPAGTAYVIVDEATLPQDRATRTAWRIVGGAVVVDETAIDLTPAVNRERDRRIAGGFTWNGKRYDTDADSAANIAGAMTMASVAITLGKQPGDLRWSDPDRDFGWIAADNTITPMDAQTCLAFAMAAADFKADMIFAARRLKDTVPIPSDYAHDSHWS